MENYDRGLEQIIAIEQLEEQEESELDLQKDYGIDAECKEYWEQEARRQIEQEMDHERVPRPDYYYQKPRSPLMNPFEEHVVGRVKEKEDQVENIRYLNRP